MKALFGIIGSPAAAQATRLGLYAQKHRGRKIMGLVVAEGGKLVLPFGDGLIGTVRDEELERMNGTAAIGSNALPVVRESRFGPMAMVLNGNLTNAPDLSAQLWSQGADVSSGNQAELLIHLLARSGAETLPAAAAEICRKLTGGYAFILLTPTQLIAALDPHGMRPLSLGRFGESWIVCSETVGIDILETESEHSEFVRDINPGEVVSLDGPEPLSIHRQTSTAPAMCSFEHVYFARPDSIMFGRTVGELRLRLGRALARTRPAPRADVVVPIPDSGVWAATGFAQESGLPWEQGIVRNHNVGRLLITYPGIDGLKIKMKYNAVKNVIEDRRIVLVDDSLMSGHTARQIVAMIRAKGAWEVHLRISSPPVIAPCFYGAADPNIPLLARSCNQEEMRRFVRADSLEFLELKDLRSALGRDPDSYCMACITGHYPAPVELPARPA